MKRSDLYIRLTTGVLFLAVASYIGLYIFTAVVNPYETTPAISYSVEETFTAQGFIVRTETVLTEIGGAVLPVVSEGEKVASGQAVAVEYTSREAIETASEIRALRLRISQLTASGSSVEAARLGSVLELSHAVRCGDLSRLDELSLNIETYIFATPGSEPELSALQARLEVLEQRNTGTRTVSAPVSGVFSQVTDGFEHIGPPALADITPAKLDELFKAPSGVAAGGKLVTEFRWFYAAVMSAEDAVRLSSGQRFIVQFSGAYYAATEMIIENIGKMEDDLCVVLFSSDRSVHEIAPLRQLRAEIVYNVVTGIRVPKEAIHLDDNATTFVYLQTGVRAERVNVEILMESGDVYIVRDGAETGSPLRSGSTIIVKANNLFDGKVVA